MPIIYELKINFSWLVHKWAWANTHSISVTLYFPFFIDPTYLCSFSGRQAVNYRLFYIALHLFYHSTLPTRLVVHHLKFQHLKHQGYMPGKGFQHPCHTLPRHLLFSVYLHFSGTKQTDIIYVVIAHQYATCTFKA